MADDEKPDSSGRRDYVSDLEVRQAAALAAVAASKVTGRPVDPRVMELAESSPHTLDGARPRWRRRFRRWRTAGL